ncbi:hypothetical protein EVAR_20469_1 [Eumeta japonica]|uniref:Uncharacterized protein n=1 Tax=Eumeta variegata TaxID=151549 RepID=A0A4C1TY41_EUMVA|nr:hypothetical protein EVAR_20469_1 [Eumeta japonica]
MSNLTQPGTGAHAETRVGRWGGGRGCGGWDRRGMRRAGPPSVAYHSPRLAGSPVRGRAERPAGAPAPSPALLYFTQQSKRKTAYAHADRAGTRRSPVLVHAPTVLQVTVISQVRIEGHLFVTLNVMLKTV